MTALNDAEDVISNLPYGLISALHTLKDKWPLDNIIKAATAIGVVDRDLIGGMKIDDVVRSDDKRYYWYRVTCKNVIYYIESDGSLGMDDINDAVTRCATQGKHEVFHRGHLWHRVRSERNSTWPTTFPVACGVW